MSERVIAKEHLPEVTAWQAFSFDPPSMREMPVKVPTADEIEGMHQQARDEGYRDGVAAGQQEIQRFALLNEQLGASVLALEGEIADQLLKLAMTLAQQIVREAILVRAEMVLPVVKEALAALVSNVKDNALHLNPAEVDLVRRHLNEELTRGAWRLVANDKIEPGGCLIEAANGSVDATLGERWHQVFAALGKNDSWLL